MILKPQRILKTPLKICLVKTIKEITEDDLDTYLGVINMIKLLNKVAIDAMRLVRIT